MNYVSFFTATVLNWKKLLANDKYKDIITGSMHFLVADGRIRIFAFVIMPNHIHIVWRVKNERNPSDVQRDFLKYSAQHGVGDPDENRDRYHQQRGIKSLII